MAEVTMTELECDECGAQNETVSYDFYHNCLLCDPCFDKLTDEDHEQSD